MKQTSSNNNKSRRNGNRRNRNRPRQLLAENSFRTELVYAESFHFSATITSHQYVTMRGNSVYDPYHAVGGHQPLGFDQLAALYQRYNVHGARMELTVYNNATAETTGFSHLERATAVVVYPSVLAAPISNTLTTLKEQPYAQHTLTAPPLTTGSVRTMNIPYRTTAQVFGQPASDQDFKSVVTGNPSKEWYWIIFCKGLNDVPLDFNLEIKVYYDVSFFARKQLNQS
jgi:hypothetical protein